MAHSYLVPSCNDTTPTTDSSVEPQSPFFLSTVNPPPGTSWMSLWTTRFRMMTENAKDVSFRGRTRKVPLRHPFSKFSAAVRVASCIHDAGLLFDLGREFELESKRLRFGCELAFRGRRCKLGTVSLVLVHVSVPMPVPVLLLSFSTFFLHVQTATIPTTTRAHTTTPMMMPRLLSFSKSASADRRALMSSTDTPAPSKSETVMFAPGA